MKQLCTFRISSEIFGVDLNDVQEIINFPKFTKIPRAQKHVIGMFNLRDQIVINVCLNTLFNINASEENTHCIILKNESSPISMNVHEILDIIDVNPSYIKPCPDAISETLKQYFEGIVKTEETIITILNVKNITV